MSELQLDARGAARDALGSAVADFGGRILREPLTLRSYISDRLPDLSRECDLIVTAAEARVADELIQRVDEQRLDADTAVNQISRSLTDHWSIDPVSSTWVTREYAHALGYRVRSAAPVSPPPTARSDPPRQPTVVSYAPHGSPDPPTAPPPLPPPTPRAPVVTPGGYPGSSPPQAPAGEDAYTPAPWPVGVGGYALTQGPEAVQVPAAVPPPGPPIPPPRRRNRRWTVFALVGVAVLGLTAGLLVWAPWHKVPVAPTGVRGQSPTATSVLVSWVPSRGGATIDRYLILRDGTQVGTVPASQASYLDHGLAPGTRHRYKVIAASGTQRSQPSLSVVVMTITPSPVGLGAGQTTWTTVQFQWSPPPNSPTPSAYVIFIDGARGADVPGGVTAYSATGLQLATTYMYQVAAVWDGRQSGRSSVLAVTTLAPPLQGDVSLRYKTLSTPGNGASLSVGQAWSDSWTFTPNCTGNRCSLTAHGEFAPPGFTPHAFTVTLTSAGGAYTGSTRASISTCASAHVQDTVTVRIAASGAVDHGAWSSWTGTMVLSSPYVTSGNQYCGAQAWTFSLTGTG